MNQRQYQNEPSKKRGRDYRKLFDDDEFMSKNLDELKVNDDILRKQRDSYRKSERRNLGERKDDETLLKISRRGSSRLNKDRYAASRNDSGDYSSNRY